MTVDPDYPDEIVDAIMAIRQLREKPYLSRLEQQSLNKAKLRIAYWVCRNENIVASRENLAYILGSDAEEIMRAYDQYMEKDATKTKKTGRKDSGSGPASQRKNAPPKDDGTFWGGA